MIMGTVYRIANRLNGKVYIGQTIRGLENRRYHHLYDAIVTKCSTKLGRAIRKYGKDSFSVEMIEETDNLDEREIHFIQHFESVKKGYNIKIGGNGGPHSESTKKKISKSNSKRVWTDEMRANMSEAIKQWHQDRGFVPKSDDFKAKISEANRNRKMSQKTKDIFQSRNELNKKPILCLTTGVEYCSISRASKELSLNSSQLSQHLKGKHRHVKGLVFKYI